MRKRDGVDEGGLLRPPQSSSRSRPASAGGGTIGRASPYLGNPNFASSSSSVNSLSRPMEVSSSSNLQQPSMGVTINTNPNGGLEAPFLASSDTHLGRMTLTAPDNMLRRKQEEKEKRQKARKRKAERAEAAIMALRGTPDSINGRNPITNHSQQLTYTTEILGSGKRRPGLTTSRSSSNLPSTINDQQRSRSPTRPQRPTSAQNMNRSDTSPERRPSTSATEGIVSDIANTQNSTANTRRVRRRKQKNETRTGATSVEESRSAQNGSSSRGRNAGSSSTAASRSAVRAEALRRATQRRRDIYADLSTMGLPGASDSEPEEGPPPFPENATRPLSPPQLPAEGEEWTEEMRRRQEEYLTNRPPDSPPPAFRSEDEGEPDQISTRVDRRTNAIQSSDEDSFDNESMLISEERRLWEEDVEAGYTFEERVERERRRRELKDLPTDSTPTQAANPTLLPNSDLGQAVRQARARRNVREEPSIARLPEEEDVVMSESSIQQTLRNTAHRRTASDGRTQNDRPTTADRNATKNSAVGTGKGLAEDRRREVQYLHGKVTKIRPRPSSESHSRFRDDASEAAKRRLAIWSSVKSTAKSVQPTQASASQSQSTSHTSLDVAPPPLGIQSISSDALLEPSTSMLRPRTERKQTSSSSGGLDEEPESTDSEAEWAKEEKQFKRMQEKATKNPSAIVDSSDEDEEEGVSIADPMMPGAFRSSKQRPQTELPELGKVGSSVPRAPPPLVLGRSRGGAAYSSSSESSNESDAHALHDEDEDSNSDSPPEMEEASSENQFDYRIPDAVEKSTSDKGKQPVRSLPDIPSSESMIHRAASESDVNSVRAGMFEEDSSSSRDFTDEDDDQIETNQTPTLRSFSAESSRPAVQNRLKDLFNTRISQEDAYGSSTSQNSSRASFEHLFDVAIDRIPSDATTERNTIANANRQTSDLSQRSEETKQKGSQTFSTFAQSNGVQQSSSRRRLVEGSERKSSWSNGQRIEGMGEAQARMEALNTISQLQRRQDSLPSGVDRDSLAALERLLARTAPTGMRTPTSNGTEPLAMEPSKLTRSGAIGNRQMSSSAFVNPRSINAPRPLGRLPTITDATRHFPPSRVQDGEEGSSRSSIMSNRPASVISTPSWMAYIPRQERQRLPEPMKPDIMLHEGEMGERGQRNISPTRNSRVLAMVERFEQQNGPRSAEQESQRPPSPIKSHSTLQRQSSNSAMPSSSSQQSSSQDDLRRRRPPPLPPLFAATGQRSQPQRLPSTEESTSDSSAMTRALRLIVLERQRQLSDGSDSASLHSRNTPPLPPRPVHPYLPTGSLRNTSDVVPEQLRERLSISSGRRPSRPLPIPPTLLPDDHQTQLFAASPHRNETGQTSTLSIDHVEAPSLPTQEQLSSTQPSNESISIANDVVEEVESVSPIADGQEQDSLDSSIHSANNRGQDTLLRRDDSFGITDLDIFASRLADQRSQRATTSREGEEGVNADDDDDGGVGDSQGRDTYDDLHLLAEFLGPAKAPGLTQDEMEKLPVGKVEVLRRRIVGKRQDGRDKVKLALAVTGVKVERCAVCLIQFKEGNLACVFPCLHVLHEQCAAKLLRNTKQCPTCRAEVI